MGRTDPKTAIWEGGILRGDLGYSRTASMLTAHSIIESLPATLEVIGWSIVLMAIGSVGFGVASTFRQNKWVTKITRVLNTVGFLLPPLLFGLLLLMCFLVILGWVPLGRYDEWVGEVLSNPNHWQHFTKILTIDALLNHRLDIFWNAILYLIAPVITLSYPQWRLFFRSTSRFIQHYSTPPNRVIPVATILGGIFVNLVNGIILAETIFNFPGIGRAIAYNAISLDMVPLSSILLVSAFLFMIGNLLIDMVHLLMNPTMTRERSLFWG